MKTGKKLKGYNISITYTVIHYKYAITDIKVSNLSEN